MKIEMRTFRDTKLLCLVAENEKESSMIDEQLGSTVGEDGLIAKVEGEVRLSDGVGTHYIWLKVLNELEGITDGNNTTAIQLRVDASET